MLIISIVHGKLVETHIQGYGELPVARALAEIMSDPNVTDWLVVDLEDYGSQMDPAYRPKVVLRKDEP